MARIDDLHKILDSEREMGYEQGLKKGLRVAQVILQWWSKNRELSQPHSHEVLMKWSEDEIKGCT